MEFCSILFGTEEEQFRGDGARFRVPEYFVDLNLDQVIKGILKGREEYRLEEFFYTGISDVKTLEYRLQIMRDFEDKGLLEGLKAFSFVMKKVRAYVGFSKTVHKQVQRKKWVLDACYTYCCGVNQLCSDLLRFQPCSKGLALFMTWLLPYQQSQAFQAVFTQSERLVKAFKNLRYLLQIENGKLSVFLDEMDTDYGKELSETFGKLLGLDFCTEIRMFTDLEMCALEARILEAVKNLNGEPFQELEAFCCGKEDFFHNVIFRFERELQFYLAYLEYMELFLQTGLPFTYPCYTQSKTLDVVEGYDLALAAKILKDEASPVCNDFYLYGQERIFVCTGPNQGGKTTFARTFGQIAHLASLGLPVPCRKALLYPFDHLFTHFSTNEDLSNNAGRLREELVRLRAMQSKMTDSSLVIMNELFASTTSQDAYQMGKKILEGLLALDCIGLYVTHIYELSSFSEKLVSLVAEVTQQKGLLRTYRMIRKAASAEVYANSIVDRYRLSYQQIKERLSHERELAL